MRSFVHCQWEDAYSIIEPQINAQMVHRWPFSAEFPIDIRFLKFNPKHGIRPNRHDYFEVLYLHSGEVVYDVQGRPLPMKRGDLFVMGSTQLHRSCSYGRGPVKAALLTFLPELIRGKETTGDDIEYLMPFLVQDGDFPHVVPAGTGIPSQVFDLILRASEELPVRSPRGRLSVKTYLKMILVLLVNHYAAFRGSEDIYIRKHGDLERLAPLFEFVNRSYSEAISVEQAALLVRMSKSSFMRFFKRVTGQPFVAYLNHLRVAKAEALLTATDKTIAEISQEVGFCDQSYFGLVFRSVMGVSPRDYKSRSGNGAVLGHIITVGQEAKRAS
jgi:AraC-like DNA-binding protein/mannose-6-phosphate isomerase-like protein (cupin superfamily)